jgi:hypothetical protein
MQAVQRELQNIVPYVMSTVRTQFTALQALTFTLQVPGDADFEARYITATATSVTANVMILDAGTRQMLFNRPIMLAMIAGTGAQPYVLPAPALFVRNSCIQVDIADLSNSANWITLEIHGFLLYPGVLNRG